MSDPAFTRGVFDQHRFMRYLNPPRRQEAEPSSAAVATIAIWNGLKPSSETAREPWWPEDSIVIEALLGSSFEVTNHITWPGAAG
jgi:hypothetical protein